MIYCLLLLCSGINPANSTLEIFPISGMAYQKDCRDYLLPSDLAFSARHQRFFVTLPGANQILIYGLQGRLLAAYTLEDGFGQDNMTYIDELDLLAVNTSKRREQPMKEAGPEKSDQLYKKRLIFITPNGELAGRGLLPEEKALEADPLQLHFHQIFSVGQISYALAMTYGTEVDFSIRRIDFEKIPAGYRIHLDDHPLHRFRSKPDAMIRFFPEQVMAKSEEALVLASAIEPSHFRRFSQSGVRTISLHDSGLISPFIPFKGWKEEIRKRAGDHPLSAWDERQAYHRHFHQTAYIGLLDTGYVLGWIGPNPDFVLWGGQNTESPSRLTLQVFDADGHPIGDASTLNQTLVLGEDHEALYLISEELGQFEILKLSRRSQ